MKQELLDRIEAREACVGVIGLGYVGLPLLLEFAAARFPVIGLDIDTAKIARLSAGESYFRHIDSERVKAVLAHNPAAQVSAEFERAADCDALIICVPTPLTRHREPDLKFIVNTLREIGPYLRKGQLVALESTTYPGTTEEVMIPLLEELSGLQAGTDFLVAYSPEREDPSNPRYSTGTIPKVVGALNDDSREAALALYGSVVCQTVPVSSCRTAEATKLLENIFRSVNIALVNELKIVLTQMQIDIWEVIGAASTKPFGYMPFYPGPGLGGHCIPIDPFYLTWKAREYGLPTRFIELAGEINTAMPEYVVQRTMLALNEQKKVIKDSRILLVGLAYKKNIDDDRESPTYALWERFEQLGAQVDYYDPYCTAVPVTRRHRALAGTRSRTWADVEKNSYAAAVIATAHDCVDHDALGKCVGVVVDTRGVCAQAPSVMKA